MLITISGPAGSGKSTVAAGLAESLGYEHVSGGDIFRDLADDRGLTPLELNKRAEEDDQIDRDLDRKQRDIAESRDDIVLESRLAGWMAGEHADFRIWLDAPLSVRAERIADREDKSVELAHNETKERGKSEALRYREYYNIDIEDRSIYDLALNTARLSPDGVRAVVESAVNAYAPDDDEGQTPVEGVTYEF
ncbi:cytidylate kinase [Natronomonas pharaonis DSM 2160]|uniref:Cytidylate kinase n=1 Tax=Natronomonas pharaonis (strain ATCC 35678 / DSM 2160 / CIP 103997 / JCM 8858 / NBRC 14720 / NCIMB 2260 / Gabara) TaxID=348780 RepID=KCY_NATPD|nr:AAA family ATPase [Natronomonas pharaonis]Q3IMV8.1 RecName: Full=Cytidylate kinase; Short=CK; AltName: Full=Cytidine monophosphate kinase; Short=CMP kinase [Natronomonas pharaonis DSM 2160]CAI50548.1 cytidylate kinase [Natronomonas pharaonis DSM 2160]